jgi:hypothetical protein
MRTTVTASVQESTALVAKQGQLRVTPANVMAASLARRPRVGTGPFASLRDWRRYVPWQGPASGAERALMGAILGVVALGVLLRPLKPHLVASNPVALEFLSGDLTAIGAAAACAHLVGGGASGGRDSSGSSPRAARPGASPTGAAGLSPWAVRAAVVFAMLPGVSSAVVYAAAGWVG